VIVVDMIPKFEPDIVTLALDVIGRFVAAPELTKGV
jgi:hypothetical protein